MQDGENFPSSPEKHGKQKAGNRVYFFGTTLEGMNKKM